MTGFASWNMFGSLAAITFTQGLNLLLNMFFGPVVNAARGIAVQAQTAIGQFSSNFQTALNPQITKSYATGDMEYIFPAAAVIASRPYRDKSDTDALAENRPGPHSRIPADHVMHDMGVCRLQSVDYSRFRHRQDQTIPKCRRRVAAADPADFLSLFAVRAPCIQRLYRTFSH